MRSRRLSRESSNSLGVGLLLRGSDISHILRRKVDIDWFEVVIEEVIGPQAHERKLRIDADLAKILDRYPVTLHGTEMSIGSVDPLNWDYLQQVKDLIQVVKPKLVTDHMCWTGVGGRKTHELLPLPYTVEAISHVANRIRQVQDFLKTELAFENPPSYITYACSEMTEWEFLTEIHRRTGAKLLMDISNIYVSSHNNVFDPIDFIEGVPKGSVAQIHLAGFEKDNEFFLDTHSRGVAPKVLDLYELAIKRFGPVTTNIEWDSQVPSFGVVHAEVEKAKEIHDRFASSASN